MTVVLDASICLAWLFEDECTPAIDALFGRIALAGAIVPALWRLEVANGLRMAIRRDRMTKDGREANLARFERLPIALDNETNIHAWSATLQLADIHDLTPYDAAYLELAQRRRVPLASLDKALRNAAIASGVDLIPVAD